MKTFYFIFSPILIRYIDRAYTIFVQSGTKTRNFTHNTMKSLFLFKLLLLITSVMFCGNRIQAESFTITKSGKEYLSSFFPETSKYFITELKVIGEINTADILFIQSIATEKSGGNLTNLDLSEVKFMDADGIIQFFQEHNVTKGSVFADKNSVLTIRGFPTIWYSHDTFDHYSMTYMGYYVRYYYPYNFYLKFEDVEYLGLDVIPARMFYGCDKLENVVLPPHVTSIRGSAFYGCKNLEKVSIPQSVNEICGSAFYGCTKLKEVIFPQSLTTIGNNAFEKCQSLSEIVIPEKVVSMGSSVFSNCGKLKSIVLPDNLETIPYGFCDGCRTLKSVNIPKKCIEISSMAFYDCDLDTIILYQDVKKIEKGAFRLCPIKCVYTMSEMPATCEDNSFPQSDKGCTLYVPTGCIERYSLTPGWKNFKYIQEMPEAMSIYKINDIDEQNLKIYSIDGAEHQSLQHGINILKGKNRRPIKIYSK